jgi:DNA-binding winged helix-turn-helix (wHTH) protein/alpha-beta hydrolase superfamily lysophospholipase
VKFIFENHILDLDRRELWRGSELIAVEPQVFDLLLYLVQNRERVVSKDDLIAAVWGGRIVSDSTLTSRINAVRKAVGDSGDEQRLIRTVARKGFRFVDEVRESTGAEPAPRETAASTSVRAPHRQDVHFCTTPDGIRIAYAEVGTGPTLLKAANYLSHLEYDWQSPVWSPFLHALASQYHLIRYDARGNGLSDWEVNDFSFEAFIHDLETVVAAAKPQTFALFGISQGCAVAVAYAVRHPERVSHLVLYGGYVRGKRRRGSARDVEQSDALLTLMRDGWGRDNPAFRQVFTSLFIPDGTAEQVQLWNDLQLKTTSPENAVRMRRAWDEIDITDLLRHVQAPTLVLHCRDDAVQPFDEGRRLAAGIPGAHFVALEGRNHVILRSDPSWSRFLEEINSFLMS